MLSRTVLRQFEDAELQRLGQDGSIPHWIDKSFLETMKDDPQVAIAMLRSVKSPAFDAVAPVTDAVAPAIVAVAPVTGAVAPVDAAAAPVIDAVAPVILSLIHI